MMEAMYILKNENDFFISMDNNGYTRNVKDIKESKKFNYNDAISFSNLNFQISNQRTKLIEVNSEEYCELVAISFAGLKEQVYKNDCEIDYDSRY